MAFGRDQNQLMIKEGALYRCTIANPELLGNGVIGDPLSLVTNIEDIGYLKRQTLKTTISRQLVEAYSGTPGQLVRIDTTQKDFMIEALMLQHNGDTWNLSLRNFTQNGYSAAGFVGDLSFIGTEEDNCSTAVESFLILTQLVNCKPVGILLFNAAFSTDTVDLAFGSEHAAINVKIKAKPHPNFNQTFNDQKRSLGLWWINNS